MLQILANEVLSLSKSLEKLTASKSHISSNMFVEKKQSVENMICIGPRVLNRLDPIVLGLVLEYNHHFTSLKWTR